MLKLGALIALQLVYGCATTGRVNDFRAFSELGNKYQGAVVDVVDQAAISNIDSNTQELLNSREQAVDNKRWSLDPDEALDSQNKAVIETSRQYEAIKQHTALLADYFTALGALAQFDGESAITASAKTTVEALQGLSPKLEALKVGAASLPALVESITPIVISGIKVRLLERELELHGDSINRQLVLQERLLAFLADRIAADQALLAERRILDELAMPYSSLSGSLAPGWRASRREILLAQVNTAAPAAQATKLSRKLRQAFLGLAEGRVKSGDLASLASDLARLLAVADAIRGKAGEPQ